MKEKNNKSFVTRIALILFVVLFITQGFGLILFVSSKSDALVNLLDKRTIFFVLLYQGILLTAVILTVVIFFNRNIKKPISEISSAVNEMKNGNLTVTLHPTNYIEIAVLTDAINSLVTQFKKIIHKLLSTTRNVTMAVKQMNQIINNISERVNSQLSSTEEVISVLKNADNSQKRILGSTHNLSEFSEENISSLTQIHSAAEEITKSTEQLFQSSKEIYSTIIGMAEAVRIIAKNSEDLSTSIEQTSTSVTQITANLKEVERSTKESATLTSKVREVASDRGMLSVADAIDGMENIAKSVVKNRNLVRQLGTKSKDIERVLSVITQITKQTNLLSLNAAILASQAGEYGKGFLVVADEIKALADRTASSAKEIADIVKTFQTEIVSLISAAEECLQLSENGVALVMKTGEAFREVIDLAHKSAELAKIIQKATEEQVEGVTRINDSMDMIRMIVEDVTRATHEQEQGSDQILNVTEKVKEISVTVKRGLEEQNTGINMISKNLELTNGKVKHIINAAAEQEKTNKELLLSVEKIRAICNNTLSITQEMTASFNSLHQEAENLMKDMEGFKLG
jgi:methyl-accepting chemotaxis protein